MDTTTSANTLPDGQVAVDIGSPLPAGTTTHANGTYAITAGGADIWGTTDQFRFVYRPFTGDVDIRARVNSLEAVDAHSKAGVMIRGALTANAPYAYSFISGTAGSTFEWRLATGSASGGAPYTPGTAPTWVRLVRTGSRFDSFRSSDGQTWTLIESIDIALPSTVYVGMAVTSHNSGVATTAAIANLSVSAPVTPPTNGAPTVTLTSPTAGQSWAAPASINIAADAYDPEGRLSRVEFIANGTIIGSDASAPYSMLWSSVPAGFHTFTARVYDLDGGIGQSANVGVTVVMRATSHRPSL